MDKKKIGEIVEEDYTCASVLHCFGIAFYHASEKTLEEVCLDKGLNSDIVLHELENAVRTSEGTDLALASYPVDLIITYLKHSHYVFVKRKLPYLASLIDNYPEGGPKCYQNICDLKLIFPIFVEDFIYHIHEEEDTLFTYIHRLDKALHGAYNPCELYQAMERHSIHQYAVEHDGHDDEMQGIRKITHDYEVDESTPLHLKVLYAELQAFETMLISHAHLENSILFPKAMVLENKVKAMLKEKTALN